MYDSSEKMIISTTNRLLQFGLLLLPPLISWTTMVATMKVVETEMEFGRTMYTSHGDDGYVFG